MEELYKMIEEIAEEESATTSEVAKALIEILKHDGNVRESITEIVEVVKWNV